jgi:hypothetical protein
VSEIVRWFPHADVTNNRLGIRSQKHTTIRRAIRHDSRPVVGGNDAEMSPSIWRHISPPGCPQITTHRVLDFHAVLGGVKLARQAARELFESELHRRPEVLH